MIQHITRGEAQQLFDCMGVEVTLPVTPDYDWFAFYGGQDFPRNVLFSHYTTNSDGLMGIIARQHVELPKREIPVVKQEEVKVKIDRKPITIILPKRYCANCKRLLPEGHKYPCCSFQCQQEYKAMIEAIEKADKQKEEYPF